MNFYVTIGVIYWVHIMLIRANIEEKYIGLKELYKDLSIEINENEKVGLIGRNGTGKSTLIKILSGGDKDYQGSVEIKRGTQIALTEQEHYGETTPLEYILSSIKEYSHLKRIIDSFSDTETDLEKVYEYTDAVNRFSELGLYNIEDKIVNSLESYGINLEQSLSPVTRLSGGEKRFVELVKVKFLNPDIALIDEPTNHLDSEGKEVFIDWFKNTKHSVLVITHDREVLKYVDRILELKDKKIDIFKGNYDSFLKQNSILSVSSIDSYEESLRAIKGLKVQIENAKAKRKRSKAHKVIMDRLEVQKEKIETKLEKPSIWIDQESTEKFNKKVTDKYNKYKDHNIALVTRANRELKRDLLIVKDLSVGYSNPLMRQVSFTLSTGDRIRIKGRNGAGKTTLIKTIIASVYDTPLTAKIFSGQIQTNLKTVLGVYEQEVNPSLFEYTLADAIVKIYAENHEEINNQKVSMLMGRYLFDPQIDRDILVKNLSGGQKARFQLIKMFIKNPNLLILDEPTNHLDLPSIEELEKMLLSFHGAILYVSHDNYFVKKIMGSEIDIHF